MAYLYSAEVISSLFDAITTLLERGEAPQLSIQTGTGVELIRLGLPTPLVKKKTASVVTLRLPEPTIVELDGEASVGILFNGDLEEVVRFSVGSLTTNPSAELILSSTALYAGGMLVVNKLEIVVD